MRSIKLKTLSGKDLKWIGFHGQSFVFFIFIAFATYFSIIYQGYYFGKVDQSFYLPYLLKISDPSLYPHDLFINTWYGLYPGYLWNGIAFFLHVVPLAPLMLLLLVAFRFLFFLAVFLLSANISGIKKVGYLSVFFWLTSKPAFGFDIFYNNFVQSQAAIPIVLFSYYFLLMRKFWPSLFLIIICFYIHPPIALYAFVIFLTVLMVQRNGKMLAKSLTAFFLATLPILYHAINIEKEIGRFDWSWITIMKVRSPHHSFPFQWGASQWVPQTILLFCFAIMYIFMTRRKIKSKSRSTFVIFIIIPITILILGTFFSEIILIPKSLPLLPFHASSSLTIMSSIGITIGLYWMFQSQRFLKQFIAFGISYFFFFNQFFVPIQKSFLIFLPLAVILFIAFRKNTSRLFIIFVLLCVLWSPYIFKRNQLSTDTRYTNWVSAQKWAYRNTDKNALFITPMYEDGFRLYSKRSTFGEWTDGTAGYISPLFLREWWTRMIDLGISKTNYAYLDQITQYNSLSATKVHNLFKKYHATFFVTQSAQNYPLKLVYKNSSFRIYEK